MQKEVKIEESWKRALESEFRSDYWNLLSSFVRDEYRNEKVYPPPKLVFSAFNRCPFSFVKVVIIGQDPYHGDGQANGLCFSVPDDVRIPPSLQNIYKEIESDLGETVSKQGNLEKWAKQGVLLLNATLTVRAHKPGSHQNKGWERFTDAIIRTLSSERNNIVFLLWGNYAREKRELIDQQKHLILETAHPSPYSANSGFFGCKHFSKANKYLEEHNQKPINW